MFALLDLLKLVYVMVNPSLTMRTMQDVAIDPMSQIVQFSTREQSPGFDQSKKCVYIGVAVTLDDPPAADSERKSYGSQGVPRVQREDCDRAKAGRRRLGCSLWCVDSRLATFAQYLSMLFHYQKEL